MKKLIYMSGLVVLCFVAFLAGQRYGTSGQPGRYTLDEKLEFSFIGTGTAHAAILCDICTYTSANASSDCVSACASKYGQQEVNVGWQNRYVAGICAEGCTNHNNLLATKCQNKYIAFY